MGRAAVRGWSVPNRDDARRGERASAAPLHGNCGHHHSDPRRKACGLLLSSGRIADPVQLFTSNIFDYGDFTANFGDDIGSRRMFDHGGRGGDIARARDCLGARLCTRLPRSVPRADRPSIRGSTCRRSMRSHMVAQAEQASKDSPTDPHHALWRSRSRAALRRSLARQIGSG